VCLIFRCVKKKKKKKNKDDNFDDNVKPLKKTIVKKKDAKEFNKIIKAKVKMLDLKENATKNVFNNDLWSSYRSM